MPSHTRELGSAFLPHWSSWKSCHTPALLVASGCSGRGHWDSLLNAARAPRDQGLLRRLGPGTQVWASWNDAQAGGRLGSRWALISHGPGWPHWRARLLGRGSGGSGIRCPGVWPWSSKLPQLWWAAWGQPAGGEVGSTGLAWPPSDLVPTPDGVEDQGTPIAPASASLGVSARGHSEGSRPPAGRVALPGLALSGRGTHSCLLRPQPPRPVPAREPCTEQKLALSRGSCLWLPLLWLSKAWS